MMLTIFFTCLIAVSTVSAADNATSDVVSFEETTFDVIKETTDDIESVNIVENDNTSINQNILEISKSQDNFLIDNYASSMSNTKQDYLSSSVYPSSGQYTVRVSDNVVLYKSGTLDMHVDSVSKSDYKYYYYLRIFDSNYKLKVSELYYGTERTKDITYDFSLNPLSTGTYTVQIMNYNDNMILREAKLVVWGSSIYPPRSDYSVLVSDTSFYYNNGGIINMRIMGITSSYYKYCYYLKIFDSNNVEKFSQLYFNDSYNPDTQKFTINPKALKWGTYTIKIINYADNEVMKTASLTVMPSSDSPTYSDYSISVDDTVLESKSGGDMIIKINPASSLFKYTYDFKLYMYDSNGNMVGGGQEYFGSRSSPFITQYSIRGGLYKSGTYFIRIFNTYDGEEMASAKLTLNSYPTYSEYSVKISDTELEYGSKIGIKMSITAATTHNYKYNYYLKIYDSNNQEVISKLYSSTKSVNSISYIDSGLLCVGSYNMKIINGADNKVMDTAKLTIKTNPIFQGYSIKINDIIMEYGVTNANVSISINPIDTSKSYSYGFYLRIFDSNDIKKKGWKFYNPNSFTGTSYKYQSINCTDLNPGEYTIKIINAEDNSVLATSSLTVKYTSNYLASIDDVIIEYGSANVDIPVSLKSNYIDNLNAYKFYLRIFDSNNVKKIGIISSGKFNNTHVHNVSINTTSLNPGKYTITVINVENDKVLSTAILTVKKTASEIDNATLPVNKTPSEIDNANLPVNKTIISTNLIISDITTTYNGNGYLVATLKDVQGNAISNALLLVNLNGAKTITTDANGQVKLTTNNLAPKTSYIATITFEGNANYTKSTKTVKVTVKKATPKLTAKAKTFKKSVKTKKYVVTLKTNQNKVMKNTKVTIKVNKKTYSAKTNKKGVATFKITKLTKKGTFKSVITYNGDKYYNKVTKTVNIKVK